MMLWEIDILPLDGYSNRNAERASEDIRDLRLADRPQVFAACGYLLQGELLTADHIAQIADELLVDRVVERAVFGPVGDPNLAEPPSRRASSQESDGTVHRQHALALVHVLPKPGVMDPVAQSAIAAIGDRGIPCDAVRTFRKYWISDVSGDRIPAICNRVLANEAIEQVVVGPLALKRLDTGSPYHFQRVTVPLEGLDNEALMLLSQQGQLFLQLAEMQTIQRYFADLGRDPTDIELETIAQTWSEHCSHKTLAGRVHYRDENGQRHFDNMLRETIFAATKTIREELGDKDWCVSVFRDNAGIIRFDDQYNLAFKVETHNHPSALEPYGGANTGIGGVIRDILGTGMGAKPIASTDVFCFAPPDTPALDPNGTNELPPGILHPRRIMRGVVEGVRDYGNRMGIPTVNGAIYFDPRYLGNPLVFCGSLGLIPRDQSFKQPQPGDAIVVLGGRTGRDGIHGATFSSAELTSESEDISGGAVQIGNAIEEKKVLDVLLVARDRGLYHAVTDCGAGGFSSAVGEMGESIGAEVWIDRAPLKYEGLSYTEIWISEAQERMVFSVPQEKVDALIALSKSEGVDAFVLGKFVPTGRLILKFKETIVGDLPMDFLHHGRPSVVRDAVYHPAAPHWKLDTRQQQSSTERSPRFPATANHSTDILLAILGSLNVASKEWVIRQYDHEVQGTSVVKPLVGIHEDGPSDAAVLRPLLGSDRAVAIACGMNPLYGDLDPGHMAASAIDEAVRNCVAVGADPSRIALLDNFCWGDCERAETLGSLVRAAIACHGTAIVYGTPFISGKDSLNNEYSFTDEKTGERRTIAIPATLLISAIGLVHDAAKCVSMDLKTPGNFLYIVGLTKNELGGSHWSLVMRSEAQNSGSCWNTGPLDPLSRAPFEIQPGHDTRISDPDSMLAVPAIDAPLAKRTFAALHAAMDTSLVRACHDLSEGGLAVAAAEMCFAGGYGAEIDLAAVPHPEDAGHTIVLLFSESNSRFLCEVPPDRADAFEKRLADIPHARVGYVT
ncbi:MAG: hypothetical protein JW829_01030, partial [Pirellulales bacterium]|nr:hypothetical protein [Pirellulales bacterium]